ncbi:BRT1, down-regulated by mating factor B [Fusarium agapanthi]|uniref:BRT1, down-regulated by mating factor B n=1 Tax=Fusarium agapanthi TaxID=1803897 RepID=A0A9P5AWU9_9HYPO|nr:BRT1, down-regulated by mating factor B [Fusarium agapanthi]
MTLATHCIAPVLSILRPPARVPQINILPRTFNYGYSRAFSASIRSYAAIEHVFSPKAVARSYYLLSVFEPNADQKCQLLGHTPKLSKPTAWSVFLSGQIPADSEARLTEGTIAEKTHKMCQNAKAVRVTVYFQNMDVMKDMNEVYAEYFPHKPARSACESPRLPAGASMEMDIIALK